MLEEFRNKKPTEKLKQPVMMLAIDANKLSDIIKDIYLQGAYDRDFGSNLDECEEISETLAITKIIKACQV